MRNAYKILGGKAKGKIPTERPKCGWQVHIKMYFRKTGLVSVG